jgi:serine/threonine protein kinase
VVTPFAVSINGQGSPLAFFPYFNQGSLGSFLRTRRQGKLEIAPAALAKKDRTIVQASLDILRGINHVHIRETVHNDPGPLNVLVRFDEKKGELHVAINNFGLASRLIDNKRHRFFKTLKEEREYGLRHRYTAPELILGGAYSVESNMYAVGLLLTELIGLEKDSLRKKLSEYEEWNEAIKLVHYLHNRDARTRANCVELIGAFERLLCSLP